MTKCKKTDCKGDSQDIPEGFCLDCMKARAKNATRLIEVALDKFTDKTLTRLAIGSGMVDIVGYGRACVVRDNIAGTQLMPPVLLMSMSLLDGKKSFIDSDKIRLALKEINKIIT